MQIAGSALSANFDQTHCELLHLLGYQYLQHGSPGKAAMIFEIIIAVDPFNAKALQALACAHLRDQQAERALAVLDQIPEKHRSDALTWLLKGQAFTKLGRLAEAARAMRMFVLRRSEEDLHPQ
jgi:Flp pilus assembly protein TadD